MAKNTTGTKTARETAATATKTDSATGNTARTDGPSGPIWDALTATPNATVSAIAIATGLSRPVVRRTLTTLEIGGHATRTLGGHIGGKRAPDTWSTATPDTTRGDAGEPATSDPDDEDAATSEAALGVADDASATGEREDATGAPEPADTASAGEGMDAAALADAAGALRSLTAAITAASEALDGQDREAALEAAEVIYGGSGFARRMIRAAANGRPRSASGAARSHPGELRDKVAAHLAAYPGKEFTPHEVAKAIGHSAGAVANALDRLTGLGTAAETCARPRRFTATAAEHPATVTA